MKKTFCAIFTFLILIILSSQNVLASDTDSAFHISQLKNGSFEEVFTHKYSAKFTTKNFELKNLSNNLTLRINEFGDLPYSGMDSAVLNACGQKLTPTSAFYVDGNKDISSDILSTDLNVVVTHNKPIQISWDLPQGCSTATLSMNANEYDSGLPFHFPSTGIASYQLGSNIGSLNIDGKLDETDGTNPIYTPYWYPSSGHPNGSVYIYAKDDADFLYFATDVTIDNTNDIGPDWISINIGDNKFKVTDSDNTYGKCGFGLTSKVSYKHQTCEIKIPKSEISNNQDVSFALEYYGTASPITVSPSSVTAGGAEFTLTVTGGNGLDGTNKIRWNGVELLPTNFDSEFMTLTAVVPAENIVNAGTASVDITNDEAGPFTFTINSTTTPGVSTNLRRVSGNYNNFILGWNPPTDGGGNIISYNVDFRESIPNSGGVGYGVGNVSSFQFSPGTFLPGHTYDFTVIAYNQVGWGAYSETFTYTFPNAENYTVSSCQDLQNINNDKYGHYTLSQDLNCGETSTWNSDGNGGYQGFLPIGVNGDGFNGTFDGGNNTISGIYINRPNTNLIGLFGVIEDGASVSNLGLENVNITGYDDVGALVGGLSGTVTNVYSTGQVNGNISVGGLAGIHATSDNFSNSSPLVYTWNGEKYKYVADVGQMILRSNSGLDLAQIDSQDLVPKDNKYSMKISEEYNEIVYYDELALMTFDHVPGYTVVSPLNRDTKVEDLRTISDTPTNSLVSCTDKYGNNCLDSLKAFDDKWSYKDNSFVNSWVLDFGNLANKNSIQLIMRGARDFAASASGNYEKIRNIEVRDSGGKWVTIYDKNSLASDGTPRLRTIDLTGKFLSDNYQVRVTMATQNINYFAIDTSPQVPFTTHTYYPTKADLQFQGFTAIDKAYYYNHDYSKISSTPDGLFVKQTGNFTKYGDVSPLLQSKNDQFVVMHYGDAMNIEFSYVAPSAGLERSFILYNDVLYKHASNDKIGSVGKTVSPLPFSGMTKYPYSSGEEYPLTQENQEYLNNWNTRVITGLDTSHGSTVIDSYSTATINGSQNVGGLVGFNNKEIRTSYATGNVNGDRVSGGLVGYNNSSGLIHNSYATGNVTVTSQNVGGLVGLNYGTITKTYATGGVNTGSDMYNYAGGLIGIDNSSGVSNSFSTGDVSLVEGNLFSAGFTASDYSSNYDEVNNYWFNNLSNGLNLVNSTGHSPINAPSKDYFKGLDISTKAPFVGQWDFAGINGDAPVWYSRSNDYPKLTAQSILPDSTCSDGILNQNETSVDAGGICSPAPIIVSISHSSSGGSSVQSRVNNLISMGNTGAARDLMNQYSNLFTSSSTPTNLSKSTETSLVTFARNLTIGSTGQDVKSLQQFLNAKGFVIAKSGPGSKGKETNKFGPATKSALIKFQKANKILPATGNFGPKTRAFIANI